MTAHIANLLRRLVCPRLLVVVDARHVDLLMSDAAHDAELEALLLALDTGEERTLGVVAERATQRIAHVVAERSDAIQAVGVGLHGKSVLRIGTRAGTPALTIYI